MAIMTDLNFNAQEVEPDAGFVPVPAGHYKAVIEDTEKKDAKSGNGSFLKLKLQIVGGDHNGRVIFHNLNLWNANETAQHIAKAQLSAICRAVNVMTPKDSAELHNIPMVITVAHEKRNDNGEIQNVIKAFDSVNAAPPETSRATSVGDKAPWLR